MSTGPIGLPATGPLTPPVRRPEGPSAPGEATGPASGGAPARGPADTGFATQTGNDSELGVGANGTAVNAAPSMDLDDLFGAEPAPRTAEDARRGAEALWFSPQESGNSFRHVERDAVDVNSLSGPRRAQLREEIAANQELEDGALHKLSRTEQQEYKHLVEMTRHDPDARLALQLLLVEGKLTDKTNLSKDGKDLLSTLNSLSRQPLARGLDRPSLISDMIQEIAVPSSIDQHNKGTCTVTSLEIMLAMEQPAEYARLVAGLASPSGKVKLANGDTLTREPGTIGPDGTPRSASAKLWQPALMEYANGKLNYNNRTDKHSDGSSGLNAGQVAHALEGLTGKKGTTLTIHPKEDNGTYRSRLGIAEAVMNQANSGKPVPIGMNFAEPGRDPSGHEVLVTKVAVDPKANAQLEQVIQKMETARAELEKDLQNPARSVEAQMRLESLDRTLPALKERLEEERTNPRVYYNNPWGIEESMAMDEFVSRVTSANLDPVAEPPASSLKNFQPVLNNLDERMTALLDRQVALKNDSFNMDAPQQYQEVRKEIAAMSELRTTVGMFRPSPDLTPEQKEQANQVLVEINRLAEDLMDPAKRAAAGPEVSKYLEQLRKFG